MLRTVVTRMAASVFFAVFSMAISSSRPRRRISWPSSRFCTMSRLSASARSWYTVAMPALAASLGERKRTGLPCQIISPAASSQIPAIVLISVDLPAPLSPTRAVTCPAGMSRSMPVSACTGPNVLLTPRRRSSGCRACAGALYAIIQLPGDPGGRARGRVRAGAELGHGDEVVLDHRGVHVRRGDPLRVGEDGRDGDLGHGVLHRVVDERRG